MTSCPWPLVPAAPPSSPLQALSNSVWALAHTRSKCIANWDALCTRAPGGVDAFLSGLAGSANHMLRMLHSRADTAHLQAFLNHVEHKFSCQVRPGDVLARVPARMRTRPRAARCKQ